MPDGHIALVSMRAHVASDTCHAQFEVPCFKINADRMPLFVWLRYGL